MWFSSVRAWLERASQSTSASRPTVVCLRKFQPRLGELEERRVPAVFNVTSLLDSNVAGSGTLRRAITDANATAGPNQINLLTPGTYRLTIGGIRDDNTAGSLAIFTNSVAIDNQSGGT